jgi:predicted transcriptional regulator
VRDVQARIVRRIALEEVYRRMSEFERKYGRKLDGLADRLLDTPPDVQMFEDYLEWSRMSHALKAYGEDEDFDYLAEETVEIAWEEISKLTPRRMDLLDKISKMRIFSINDLAAKTGRNVKNIHGDLKVLERLGFIRLAREGRRTRPELLVQEVTLLLG